MSHYPSNVPVIEYALQRTSGSLSHKERSLRLTLDMTKRPVCYEIVMRRSFVVIRARLYWRPEEHDSRRYARFPVALFSDPPRLYYARIGNVPEKPGLGRSRERRVTGRTWDGRGLSSFSSGSARPEGLDRSTRPPFSRQRGQRPSSGRASASAIISRGANRRAYETREMMYTCTREERKHVRVRVRVCVPASVHEILSLVSRPADTFTRC